MGIQWKNRKIFTQGQISCTFLGSKVNPLELFFSKMLRPGHGTKCHQINSAYHTLPFVNQLITLGYFSGSVSVRFYFSQPMLLYPIFGVFLPPANEVCECYVFTPVCQSFCSRGVCSSAWWDAPPCPHPPARGRHPPGDQRQTPPRDKGQTPPPPPKPRGRYPPGSSVCWEIRATSGRYASYWNAYLLCMFFLCSKFNKDHS